ncbi:ROK family protein [Pradoshia sp. D12]|uniref:ROK family protein n=1 Tax=Bacillaceae TaxID=186817 RepID=UPI00112C5E14|nr:MULTISPECIES: ROK family protein [Bacillaceae]QFK72913.1 ROK family protein [Pradoshia sp. D12]TPF71905.1 ROK family protein [Bacillus sp. D12]
MAWYLVFDIGATSVKYCWMNEIGQISAFNNFSSEGKDGSSILESIKELILQNKDKVSGVAISSAGIIDSTEGKIIKSGAFQDLQDKHIKNWMGDIVPELKVTIENDGNCAVYAEKWLGEAKELDNFISISIGTGVGGGIFLNGKLYRGSELMTGEFGSIYTQSMSGTSKLNSISGIKGVRRRYAAYLGIEMEEVSGEEIFYKYGQGDYGLDRIVSDFYSGLALFISNLHFIINPERIIINGGITLSETFLPMLTSHLKLYGYNDASAICISPLKNRANLVGALYYHLNE